jgi:SAM-dependent methyltransferase
MLDIACGRGRYALSLANKGFDVTGIDISPSMIEVAQTLANENLHFYVHDMRLPFRINYFHYVFNFFTSFGYFNTRREHDDALRTMSTALKPGGSIVIDYLNKAYAEDHLVHKEKKEMDGVVFYITRWMDEQHFFKKIEIEDDSLNEPDFIEKGEQILSATLMICFTRIQLMEVYGDYSLNRFDLQNQLG